MPSVLSPLEVAWHIADSESSGTPKPNEDIKKSIMKPTPPELDRIVDKVLAHKPKPKTKASKRRARKKRQANAKKG